MGNSPIGNVHLGIQNRLVAFDRFGERRWSLDVMTLGGHVGEILGARDGGALIRFAYDRTFKPGIARIERDGRVRWRIETAGYTQLDAAGEDWLLSTEEAGIERRADRDGALVWRSEPAAGFRVVVAVAPDARTFAAGPCCAQSSPFGRYAGDVWWHDTETGARLGAMPSADAPSDDYFARPRFAFDEAGRLIRVHAELDAASGRLVVERHALRTAPGASLARTHARGLWRASMLDGQALHVSVDARGNVDGRWFTFSLTRANDPREQRWFRLTGSARGERLELAIEAPVDAAFAGGDAGYRRVGTAHWRQLECGRAEIDYRFAGTLDDVSGRMILERADGATCSDDVRVAAAPEVELWHDTGGAGRALALAFDRSGSGAAFGLWPTWAPTADGRAGAPQWLTLAIDARGEVEIHRTLRGRFEDGPTSNTWRVGRGRFVSRGCDRATLEFAFDDDEIAEPFRALRGTLALDRRGACR
ncbi:MAG TPA: hypothetical protein VFO79_11385 [Xanthomonadales bacterium]|nr:hypothetical protein [Xanthomonadales bacterium]